MTIRFSPEARQEIREALLHSSSAFGLGRELREAIRSSLDRITMEPNRFRALVREIRIHRLHRFPYSIIFTCVESENAIHVYAFAHTSRRPGYWKPRIHPLP